MGKDVGHVWSSDETMLAPWQSPRRLILGIGDTSDASCDFQVPKYANAGAFDCNFVPVEGENGAIIGVSEAGVVAMKIADMKEPFNLLRIFAIALTLVGGCALAYTAYLCFC